MKRFLSCSVAALVLGSAAFAGAQGEAASAPAAARTAPAAAPVHGGKEVVTKPSEGAMRIGSSNVVLVPWPGKSSVARFDKKTLLFS
jgi:hypothetical protein